MLIALLLCLPTTNDGRVVARSEDVRPSVVVRDGCFRSTVRRTGAAVTSAPLAGQLEGSAYGLEGSTCGLVNGTFLSALDGWTADAGTGGGSVVVVPGSLYGSAVMSEGGSFLVSLQQSFCLPAGTKALSLCLEAAEFDTTSSFIPDAFEITLLRDDLTPAVPTWDPFASSFYNQQEDGTVHLGAGTTVSGNTIKVDLSHLADEAQLHLFLDLIGGDADYGSAVRLTNVSAIAPEVETYGCGFAPDGSLTLAGGAPRLGQLLTIGVDNPLGTQSPGSLPFLALAFSPDPAYPCGTPIPGFGMAGVGAVGELLVVLQPPGLIDRLPGAPWAGAGSPVAFDILVPDLCVLAGVDVYFQGLILDPAPGAAVTFGFTQGMRCRIAP